MTLKFAKSGSAVGLALALFGAIVSSGLVYATASASMATLTFSGVLTSAADNFNLGDPFTASVVYDTNSSPFLPITNGTEFGGPAPLLVTVGTTSYRFGSVVTNFQFLHGSNAMSFVQANGLAFVDITNLPVIPTTSLPSASYLLNATYTFGLDVTGLLGCCEAIIGGPASLSVGPAPPALTPLPSSWTMFLVGLAGIGLIYPYRRRSNHGSAGIAIA